jgi:hypothetical protein
MALFRLASMSALRPQCAAKRTLTTRSDHAAAARSSLSAPRRLLVEFAFQQALPLYPAASGEFFARAINLRLRFAGIDPARPSELTVVNGNKTELFMRTD